MTTWVVDGLRSPHGKYGGTLRDVPMTDLAVQTTQLLLQRVGIDPAVIDEVVLSCRHQAGNGPNPARTIAVKSGLAESTPAHTVNMACASGLKAVWAAQQAIAAGDADIVLVSAADSMSSMPYYGSYKLRWEGAKPRDITLKDGWRDGEDPLSGLSMGLTAENVAAKYGISRAAQDEWAARSHQRAEEAWAAGSFGDEVVTIDTASGAFSRDETVRPGTTVEKLSRLAAAFREDGTVTAGNASQMGDAAASILLASTDAVKRFGLRPRAALRSVAAVGVDPKQMGVGPVEAIPKALARAGISLSDVDLFEINEAFAAQIVQNVRALGLDEERVNRNGGGIALGHPTGETGGRLIATLLRQLEETDSRYAVASMCVGGGQGAAAVLERVPR
ncbi:thiolase family protein [Salinibacterium sp. ZJ450]|uniref:thiolase family protein n=1 Tax=Salinibacterium sp. ZJ450 TaxID=2708338 RepID=UPI00141FDA68|nr:thiolase family protein [Salinibacterium sp. ZJ450]